MTRVRPGALAIVGLLALSACANTSTGPQYRSTSTKTATATVTTSSPAIRTEPVKTPMTTALTFPPVNTGEVARVTLSTKGVSGTTRHASTKGSFVVRAACLASGPGATVTYNVTDQRANTPNAQRTLTSGEVPCDGNVTANGASPLVGDAVHINLTHISDHVIRAYAVIVPE